MKYLVILTLSIMSVSTFAQSNSQEIITLGLRNAKVTENGKNVLEQGGACGYGEVVGFQLPKKGWFIASIKPFEGYDFQKIGKLDDDKISFEIDDRDYELISDQPISSQVITLDLWIVRITPSDKNISDGKGITCASSFKYWLEKKFQQK